MKNDADLSREIESILSSGGTLKAAASVLGISLERAKDLQPVSSDDLESILDEIDKATSSREISKSLQKLTAKRLAARIHSDELSSGDFIRLMGLINDRVDGKVADKLEHSGNVGMMLSWYDEVCNKSRDILPSQEYDVIEVEPLTTNEEKSNE